MNQQEELTTIRVRGAREHNLKNIDLEIPRDQLVVVTGLSGSGKSSLAFDTIYAEGQRRYVECMSPYARQFLGMMKKPDVDTIDGLSPAISIEQKSVGQSPRSTVGTVTEIYDYLRLLYAKIGIQYCVNCKIPVHQQTTQQIIDSIIDHASALRSNNELFETAAVRCQILAPLVKGRKGHYRELFDQLRRQGFTRVRVDGELQNIVDGMQLPRYKTHVVELVVDRLEIQAEQPRRLTESIETALSLGDSGLTVLFEQSDGSWKDVYYSTTYSCPQCGQSYETPAPNMFSFNSPFGACDVCEGLGVRTDFNLELVVPDAKQTIAGGGIGPLGKKRDTFLWKQVLAYSEAVDLPLDKPINTIDPTLFKTFLEGGDSKVVRVSYGNRMVKHTFAGVLPTLRHQMEYAGTSATRTTLQRYLASVPCSSCGGARLKTEHLHVLVNEKNISECTGLDIVAAESWFADLLPRLSDRHQRIAGVIVKEILSRLHFLHDVGLTYLTLDRSARTLSGGESQRIRLASQIGSQLVGVTYVLDEPSIGLHQHDNMKLITSLKNLRDLGNTIIVVEHDKEMIEEADHVIDIGPGAGVHGGHVVAEFRSTQATSSNDEHRQDLSTTTPDGAPTLQRAEPMLAAQQPAYQLTYSSAPSLTFDYITGHRAITLPKQRRPGTGKNIVLRGARGHNLKQVDLTLPLGQFVCITGMSGSGKSTLINETLFPILARHLTTSELVPLPYDAIEGLENIDKVIEIDQSPIGRTPRSNPATYTGLFTQIRDFFTMLPEAKIRGYKSGRFSFNVAGGRCEECEGAGLRKIEMNFLPDVYVNCDTCNGKRYNAETLNVKFKGKSIADVLDMTVEEALDFFMDIPKIKHRLQTLWDVGLTYVRLGQQAPTLSGGEAQRVKLATELARTSTGNTVYLLDEPTTGLHFEDVRVLLKLLDRLVDRGNTVVVIEHNLDVIAHADHLIDLGPEGGSGGGYIVAEGTPEHVSGIAASLTGHYVKLHLADSRLHASLRG
ncbi:MAG: ATP-binding cassette domain-containing protein [Bradyrhizobiaceae bacterium]|nr:ATP-binding cassette domain-containing protein [Bradyrhizobiaceae bacterium]